MKPVTRTFYEQAVQQAIEYVGDNLDEALNRASQHISIE
jgi:hypothetical protein